jgi:glycosyltransferase involved in cell wall biosynthesis
VAVVTETYPPEINGVAGTVARLVEGLLARGHKVHLVRPRQGAGEVGSSVGTFTESLTPGMPIPRYPELKLGFPAGRRLAMEWERARPDVVHLATPGPLAWSALRIAERARIPVVSEFRTNFHAYSRYYGIGFLRKAILAYLRSFHNRTACTMAPTPHLAWELESEGFQRVTVVARGVDANLFDPARRSDELRRQWGAGPETLVVICVGRLAMEKNLGLIAWAFERIQRARPDARLVLVGDGPARDFIQKRCPRAIFAGKRIGEDLAAHYASADLLLFPSLTETFGNVTIEGMASGLAVVAFDYGAAHELVRSGQNGWTVPFGDESAFLRTVSEVAADSTALGRARAAAREEVRQRGWDQIVRLVEGHYREALMRIAKEVATEAMAESESEAGARCAVERRGEVAEAVEPAA